MLKIAIILGCTRPNRIGEGVARWVYDIAARRTDAQAAQSQASGSSMLKLCEKELVLDQWRISRPDPSEISIAGAHRSDWPRPRRHQRPDEEFTAKICFYETPFIYTLRLKFSGNEVTVNSESNVGFGSTKQLELIGKSQ